MAHSGHYKPLHASSRTSGSRSWRPQSAVFAALPAPFGKGSEPDPSCPRGRLTPVDVYAVSTTAEWSCVMVAHTNRNGSVPGSRADVSAAGGHRTLAHVLEAASIPLEQTLIIRHTYNKDGLRSVRELTPELVRSYTRGQLREGGKFPADPPRWWVVFVKEPACKARLYTVYDNAGEIAAERTPVDRFYDLRDTDLLRKLRGKLLIQWTNDPINWAKSGATAWSFPVLEIAECPVIHCP